MTTNRNSSTPHQQSDACFVGLMSYNGTICIPDPLLVDTFHHQDGSTSYVLYDQDCESPRVTAFPDPLTVLTQTNSRYRKVDDAPELREALNRLPEPVAFRYMKAFHDVAAITAWHDHSGRYGHIYLTRAALLAARPRIAFASVNGADAEAVMRAELSEYQAWADGEVYGCINVDADGGEESCWGFIGYDSLEEVVAQVCESPILGTK